MLFGLGTPIRLFPFFLGLHGIYRASSLERPMSRFFFEKPPQIMPVNDEIINPEFVPEMAQNTIPGSQ